VKGMRSVSRLMILHVHVWLSPALSLFHCIAFAILSKIS
jgi:hypothetical protein